MDEAARLKVQLDALSHSPKGTVALINTQSTWPFLSNYPSILLPFTNTMLSQCSRNALTMLSQRPHLFFLKILSAHRTPAHNSLLSTHLSQSLTHHSPHNTGTVDDTRFEKLLDRLTPFLTGDIAKLQLFIDSGGVESIEVRRKNKQNKINKGNVVILRYQI